MFGHFIKTETWPYKCLTLTVNRAETGIEVLILMPKSFNYPSNYSQNSIYSPRGLHGVQMSQLDTH